MRQVAPRRGSLVVVGTGIKLAGQTTIEAVDCMQRAERLLYLVTDPPTEAWIRRLNPADTDGPFQTTYQTRIYPEIGRISG